MTQANGGHPSVMVHFLELPTVKLLVLGNNNYYKFSTTIRHDMYIQSVYTLATTYQCTCLCVRVLVNQCSCTVFDRSFLTLLVDRSCSERAEQGWQEVERDLLNSTRTCHL